MHKECERELYKACLIDTWVKYKKIYLMIRKVCSTKIFPDVTEPVVDANGGIWIRYVLHHAGELQDGLIGIYGKVVTYIVNVVKCLR